MKVRDILKRLHKDGWRVDRTRGDHRQFVHDDRPDSDTVTVAGRPKDELPRYAKFDNQAGGQMPSSIATGPTLQATRQWIAEAIQFHVEGLQRRGARVPEPSAVADTVEVAA